MTETTDRYQQLAYAYAGAVRELLAPSRGDIAVRGVARPASPEKLAEQAERLMPVSAEFTRVAADRLAADDPTERVAAENALLAKALTDLEVCGCLLQAAMDEEAGQPLSMEAFTQRGGVGIGDVEERLRIIMGQEETQPIVVRSGDLPGDVTTARLRLSQSIVDVLNVVTERTSQAGQMAFGGLLALGASELARAVGLIGTDVVQALGQADKVTRLYNAFREFALHAYESLIALLGQQIVHTVAQQVVTWLDQLQEGPQVQEWLAELYETEETRQELSQVVARSQADLQHFIDALQGVKGLDETYRRRVELVDRLLRGLRFFSSIPAAALPQGRLLMAAAYVVLAGYLVLTGADYLDARRLEILDRVPGVRQVVETNLTAPRS